MRILQTHLHHTKSLDGVHSLVVGLVHFVWPVPGCADRLRGLKSPAGRCSQWPVKSQILPGLHSPLQVRGCRCLPCDCCPCAPLCSLALQPTCSAVACATRRSCSFTANEGPRTMQTRTADVRHRLQLSGRRKKCGMVSSAGQTIRSGRARGSSIVPQTSAVCAATKHLGFRLQPSTLLLVRIIHICTPFVIAFCRVALRVTAVARHSGTFLAQRQLLAIAASGHPDFSAWNGLSSDRSRVC